ncbi:MAG: enoyl-CoA hydratase-related protein [Bdellovibrionales bacterium]
MAAEVLFETRGSVFIVTFNRPEARNALTTSMAKELSAKLKSINEDRSLRALLLRGANNIYMDGQDMSGFAGDINAVQEQISHRVQFFYSCIREMMAMDRPVISAVDGRVSGAGLSFMLASDIVVATKRSTFNAGTTQYAMIPDGGTTFFLPRKIGMAHANELLLLGEDFDADRAEKLHLITRLVENDALEAQAMAFAERLAKGPTRVLGATKRLINKSFEQDLNTQLSQEASAWTSVTRTFDFREGMKASAGKREPKYTGA